MTTTKSAAHTPGEWQAISVRTMERPVRIGEHFAIRPPAGPTLAFLPDSGGDVQRANAARIVLCVNTHDELVAALRVIAEADHPDSPVGRGPVTEHEFAERLMRVARAAIARAEGRE